MEDQPVVVAVAVAPLHVDQAVGEAKGDGRSGSLGLADSADCGGICAICLEAIPIQDTALVIGCEHGYCVTCILRWATYSQKPSCPQCKHPFESLNVHRSLDGCIHDYMFEESVCLLLRAAWFVPLAADAQDDTFEELEDLSQYYEEDDELDDYYTGSSSSIRIGNRRWGDTGYVSAGRKEARPVSKQFVHNAEAGSSRGHKKKEASSDLKGRRAKRALKREAADKAAAEKHQQHLQRLGRK